MDKVNHLIPLFLILFGIGCSPISNMVRDATPIELKTLKEHKVNQIQFDFESECKIRIKSQSINRSGACSIFLTQDNHMKFTLNSPFGGAVMISYMDEDIIQLLNRQEKTFYQAENNKKNRRSAFVGVLDLKVEELRELLWGRKIKSRQNQLDFKFENQRPISVRKITNNQNLLVKYLGWQEVSGISIPRRILMEDRSQNLSIMIFLTSVELGFVGEKGKQSLLKNCDLQL